MVGNVFFLFFFRLEVFHDVSEEGPRPRPKKKLRVAGDLRCIEVFVVYSSIVIAVVRFLSSVNCTRCDDPRPPLASNLQIKIDRHI